MNSQPEQICERIIGVRESLDMTPGELAAKLGIPESEYLGYEKNGGDIPVGVIYGIAAALRVDPTFFLTGENPNVADVAIVRGGQGVSVERYKGYRFTSLAANYIDREMEPMLVTIEPNSHPIEKFTHGGQEFNLVLEGVMTLIVGDKEYELQPGDSAFFDPRIPHMQAAKEGEVRFLTVINE